MNNKILSELNSFSKDEAKNSIINSKVSAEQITDNMQEVSRVSDIKKFWKVINCILQVINNVANIKADIYKLKDKLDGLEPNWDTKLGRAEENSINLFL